MTQHYTRNTVSVSAWCKTCGRRTSHRVDDRRLGPCLECPDKGETKAQQQLREKLELERQQPKLEGF